MKKILKIVLALAVVAVLLLVVGVFALIAAIDSVAKKGIEAGGTYAMGVPTTLKSADIGLFSGNFGLSGLSIANPPGYKGQQFFLLGEGKLALSLAAMQGDVITIPLLSLSDINLSLEKQGDKANYQVILDNLAKLSSSSGGEKPKPAPTADGPEKKLIISELVIRNVKVHAELVGGGNAVTDALNKASSVDVTIPEIKLSNVGKTGDGVGGSGVTMSQLSSIVMQAILSAVANSGAGISPEMLGDLKGSLGKLGDLSKFADVKQLESLGKNVGEVGKNVGEAAAGAADKAKQGVDDLKKGLGGLIPGGKKEEPKKEEPKK